MYYEEYLAHFNPNHDPKDGKFAKKNGSAIRRRLVNKKAVSTGLIAGGILAGSLAVKYAMTAKQMSSAWNRADAALSPTPALLRMRRQSISNLRKNAVVQTGKRFVLGALAGYGGYVLTKDGLFEKKAVKNQNGND